MQNTFALQYKRMYEVKSKDGIELDGAEFVQGELLDVNPELPEVAQLLADGSLVPFVDDEGIE